MNRRNFLKALSLSPLLGLFGCKKAVSCPAPTGKEFLINAEIRGDDGLESGRVVEFRVYDDLFKKWTHAIGKIENNFYGKMWVISAKSQPGLHPNFQTWVHEDNINA